MDTVFLKPIPIRIEFEMMNSTLEKFTNVEERVSIGDMVTTMAICNVKLFQRFDQWKIGSFYVYAFINIYFMTTLYYK